MLCKSHLHLYLFDTACFLLNFMHDISNPEENNLYSVLHKDLCSLFAHQIVKPSEFAVKTILNFIFQSSYFLV